MNTQEEQVGNFYGIHHDIFRYRKKESSAKITAQILKVPKIPLSKLNRMTCMEAGGAGNKARGLAQGGARHVYYIDLSKQNTDWTREDASAKGMPITTINGSILDAHPELNNTCDLIICTGVIHHTLVPALALLNMTKWMKKDGILYINCYRSGCLYFLPFIMIRELLTLTKINYEELFQFLNQSGSHLRAVELMDHAFAPVINPTNADIMRHDLELLDYKIIMGDRSREIDHNETNPMITFVAKKVTDSAPSVDDLKYQKGINQFSLPYEQTAQEIIDKFFVLKEKLSHSINLKLNVLAAVIDIAKIINAIQDTETFIWRLRSFKRSKDIRVLLEPRPPKKYFYKKIRVFLTEWNKKLN